MSASDPRDEPLQWNDPPQPTNATDVLPDTADPQPRPAPSAPLSAWSPAGYPEQGGQPYGEPSYGSPSYEPPTYPTEPLGPFGPFGPPPAAPPPYDPFDTGRQRPPNRPGPPWGRRVGAGAVLVAVAIASGVAGAVIAGNNSTKTVVSSQSPVNITGSGSPTETLAKVAAAVSPSVVSITVDTGSSGDTGSGVILRSDGTIVTNNHVVEAAADGAGTISVKFADGTTASATIVGRDPGTDLAVIKASGVSGKTPATLGSTSTVHVGDTVLAIGSPLGLDGSVSSGIVSALHRTVALGSETGGGSGASVSDAIQTDAAINPGNSGGPLVDEHGHVIGVNSAIASLGQSADGSQSGNIGVGFAIPVDEVRSVANQLINGQTPKHALLGVEINDDPNGGALITSVTSGSAASKGGLQVGDVITEVGQTPTGDGSSLSAAIRARNPGDKVTVHYRRNGVAHTTTVTLGSA
jgi:putative serine protease PepD